MYCTANSTGNAQHISWWGSVKSEATFKLQLRGRSFEARAACVNDRGALSHTVWMLQMANVQRNWWTGPWVGGHAQRCAVTKFSQ